MEALYFAYMIEKSRLFCLSDNLPAASADRYDESHILPFSVIFLSRSIDFQISIN